MTIVQALVRIASAISLIGIALLAAAGPLYRIGILSLENAFGLLRWAAYAGVAGMLVALGTGALAYGRGTRLQVLMSCVMFLLALTAFAVPFQWQRNARALPPIHDITTDLENPPTFEAVIPLRGDAPNTLDRPPILAQQQREGYPNIAPITLPIPRDRAFDIGLQAAQQAGWEIVTADKVSGRIEAIATTRWFGFKDDVVVRLTPWGSGTRVDVRSVSRVGRSDVGTNARRIRLYLELLAKNS
jgi:uncharacterized protein (DUF1499 family)